jgi:four helix bundle protein
MSRLGHAESFRDLVVYQKARRVTKDIFELTKRFPREETFSLTDQIRRSSRSVGAQIAESWAKRRYERHFISKLTDADGEQQETQHWIESAYDCEYLSKQEAGQLIEALSELGKMISSMIQKADLFCSAKNNMIKEDRAEYFIECQTSIYTDN